jgi:hypothetical protein
MRVRGSTAATAAENSACNWSRIDKGKVISAMSEMGREEIERAKQSLSPFS